MPLGCVFDLDYVNARGTVAMENARSDFLTLLDDLGIDDGIAGVHTHERERRV